MNEESPVARADRLPLLLRYPDVIPLTMESAPSEDAESLAAVIGGHVHQRRKQLGLSLETLARRSRVSRAMLSQIERGRSTPTIGVLWKIARALEAPISALLSEEGEETVELLPVAGARRLYSKDGCFCSRALFPFDKPQRVEFYELRLESRGEEAAKPYSPGILKNLVIGCGEVEIVVDGKPYALVTGDAIQFKADVAHIYRNVGQTEAVLYLVMTYVQTMG